MNRYSSVHRNKTKVGRNMDLHFQNIVLSDTSGNTYQVPLLLKGDGLVLSTLLQPFPGASYTGDRPAGMSRQMSDYLPACLEDRSDSVENLLRIQRAIEALRERIGWDIDWALRGEDFYLLVNFEPESRYLEYADQGDGMRLVALRTRPIDQITVTRWNRGQILELKPLRWLANLISDEVAYQAKCERDEAARRSRLRQSAAV